MQTVNLYRYNNCDRSVTVTPQRRADTDEVYAYRLIADDGCVLTDGDNAVGCVDTHEPEQWTEIEDKGDGV